MRWPLLNTAVDGMIQHMRNEEKTTEFLLRQSALPDAQLQDLCKGLHQSVFGCGHFVTDAAAEVLRRELDGLTETMGPDLEPLDGAFCRVYLRVLQKTNLAPDTLLRLFALSAQTPCGRGSELEEKLAVLLRLCREGRLPFSAMEAEEEIAAWREAGFPACHHSEPYRAANGPAYRVIRREYSRWLPLLAEIDGLLAKQERVIVALEGGSASGKTTLAALLERIYGCTVFHMDDFFLRPEQRTTERLAEAGGNIDRERFAQEILRPLTERRPVRYRRYDCHTQTLQSPVTAEVGRLVVVEGAYSMHPELAEAYDLSAFLRITPQLQRRRILKRNGPELAERFFHTWIPMEQAYFETMDTANRCDLILEVDE